MTDFSPSSVVNGQANLAAYRHGLATVVHLGIDCFQQLLFCFRKQVMSTSLLSTACAGFCGNSPLPVIRAKAAAAASRHEASGVGKPMVCKARAVARPLRVAPTTRMNAPTDVIFEGSVMPIHCNPSIAVRRTSALESVSACIRNSMLALKLNSPWARTNCRHCWCESPCGS